MQEVCSVDNAAKSEESSSKPFRWCLRERENPLFQLQNMEIFFAYLVYKYLHDRILNVF